MSKDEKITFYIDRHKIEIYYNKMLDTKIIYYQYNNNKSQLTIFYDSYNKNFTYNIDRIFTPRQKKMLLDKINKLDRWCYND